ncbi:(d)CMP kinase [Salibacterium halotolerans]|uniref:Cytidylate kinase n=1 Tax=Salibacterium halotolerans TaxID=1884432 RepID=A0A1I5Q3P9_9BACI|nr:(d)CMP kinase [Salibacterium halotolerans]SFP40829.1 cytidylate kinase [Salibacterium halotolerans]
MNKINIAIDGPAGAGKSTVARTAASQLQYVYIDTGAMYRALTWNAIHHNVDIQDEAEISMLLKKTDIELLPSLEGNRVFVDGEEVTSAIRSNDVTAAVSDVSAHEEVRRQMVKKQQELAQDGGAVLDGRDIGTAVLPDAELKVFLSASVEERAKRRHLENVGKGISSDLQMMMKDIQVRDGKDTERDISPLVQAGDAVHVDTTDLTAEEAAAEICVLARERIHQT